MEKQVVVEILGKNSIIFGNNLTNFIVKDIIDNVIPKSSAFVIITDAIVGRFYLDTFLNEFEKLRCVGSSSTEDQKNKAIMFEKENAPKTEELRNSTIGRVLHYIVEPGEGSKTRETVSEIQDFLLSQCCNRDTALVALGGGVIGDIVGFIASTYLRGVPFFQIPTSLLAMVDSSIGGKNGVDTPLGKNLIGTIYQPIRLYIDTNFLSTLPQREFSNGMAEVIKTCALSLDDDNWFEFLEKNGDNMAELMTLIDTKPNQWDKTSTEIQFLFSEIILFSVKFKARVVTEDVGDKGLRQILNFGHTIGHAIEQHYAPNLLHGECVAIGMILESKISIGLKHAKSSLTERLRSILHTFFLPVGLDDEIVNQRIGNCEPINMDLLMRTMKLDKKNTGGHIHMILLTEIGKLVEPHALPVSETDIVTNIRKYIEKFPRRSVHFSTFVEKEGNLERIDTAITTKASISASDSSIVIIGYHADGTTESVNGKLGYKLAQNLNWNFENQVTSISLKNVGEKFFEKYVIVMKMESISCNDFLKTWTKKNDSIVIHVISSIKLQTAASKSEFDVCKHLSKYSYFFEGDVNNGEDLDAGAEGLVHVVNYARGNFYNWSLPQMNLFRSFFVCLLVPDVTNLANDLPSIVAGAHALELRVDLLQPLLCENWSRHEVNRFIARQVSIIRRKVKIPIIFTIRTISEGGKFPDTGHGVNSKILFQLFRFAIRIGCEIIDIQMRMCEDAITNRISTLASLKSRIIASYHSLDHVLDWIGTEGQKWVSKGQQYGDVVKIVSKSDSQQDNRKLAEFIEKYVSSQPTIPLIAINMGRLGQVTRMTNHYMTPVSHSALTAHQNVRLCQLTIQDILHGLTLMGEIEPKKFYLIGHPISHSLSPLIHNTNFNYFKLPHSYRIMDTKEITLNDKHSMLKAVDFGGASVTMPHKVSILSFLDTVSPIAQKIGAVNTIIKIGNKLKGENTDWLGIYHCISRISKKIGTSHPTGLSALLIGAGGTARAAMFALQEIGFGTIFMYNRTLEKLHELESCCPNGSSSKTVQLKTLEEVVDLVSPQQLLCVIVDTTPLDSKVCTAGFVNKVFSKNSNIIGILVKMGYDGSNSSDEELNPKISLVTGVDVLIEQALWQAELWTGLKPEARYITKFLHASLK